MSVQLTTLEGMMFQKFIAAVTRPDCWKITGATLRKLRREENTCGYLIIRNKQLFLVELSGTAHLYLIYRNVSNLVQSEWFLSLDRRKHRSG